MRIIFLILLVPVSYAIGAEVGASGNILVQNISVNSNIIIGESQKVRFNEIIELAKNVNEPNNLNTLINITSDLSWSKLEREFAIRLIGSLNLKDGNIALLKMLKSHDKNIRLCAFKSIRKELRPVNYKFSVVPNTAMIDKIDALIESL